MERPDDLNKNLEHLMRCPDCGKLFDMRDLGQVFEHEHRDLEIPRGFYGKKISNKEPDHG